MDILHDALEQATADLPQILFERQLAKKLRDQGITPTKPLLGKLAKHILSRNTEPFTYDNGESHTRTVDLKIDKADVEELVRAVESFQETQLPRLIEDIAGKTSKKILKDLESRWPSESEAQRSELAEFRRRFEERWGKPLDKLRMLLTMTREWCQETHNRELSKDNGKRTELRSILIRLLVRACQVTDEMICLLENGFADGAMARWRTLHEIAVVATVISQHGEEIAERYIAHQAVESKRAMDKYLACFEQLGYRPLSAHDQQEIVKAYDQAVAKYGRAFASDYGWAASHLKKDRPTFAHLEAEAGRAEMRSHYQLGNDNIHAGIKSMYDRLGVLDGYDGLLSGRSNAGLTEPGQNAALTLTQLAVLVCLSDPNFDDLVTADMLRMLRDKIPQSFGNAETRLRMDDKKHRRRGG